MAASLFPRLSLGDEFDFLELPQFHPTIPSPSISANMKKIFLGAFSPPPHPADFRRKITSELDLDTFNRLEFLLKSATEINREEPTPIEMLKEINSLITPFCKETEDTNLILILKMLSNSIFSESTQLFVKVLTRILTVHPDLHPYFSETDEDPIITPLGVGKILTFFESDYGFPKGALSSKTIEELPKILDEIILSLDDKIVKGFVISNPPIDLDPHLTPLFIVKNGTRVNIFISDSRGHNPACRSEKPYLCESLKTLIQYCEDHPQYWDKLSVYSYIGIRQRDYVSCPVFSIFDLKALLERYLCEAEDIFDFFKRISSPKSISSEVSSISELPIFEVDTLPPEMMKITQSYSQIRDYCSKSPSFEDSKVMPVCLMRRSDSGTPYLVFPSTSLLERESLSYRSISQASDSFQNRYADHKRFSLITRIITHVLDKA